MNFRLARAHFNLATLENPDCYPDGRDLGENYAYTTDECLAALTARPEQWSSYYNLGNSYLNRSEVRRALAAYDTARKSGPRGTMMMVNAAMAYAQAGEEAQAEKSPLQAIMIAPDNAAALNGPGLLSARAGRSQGCGDNPAGFFGETTRLHKVVIYCWLRFADNRGSGYKPSQAGLLLLKSSAG